MTETSLLAEQMRESISAMVDNEAQQIELQRVLKATEDEPAVVSAAGHSARRRLSRTGLHTASGYVTHRL